jgi:conjugal transfer pilus assembly protein TraB
MKDKFKAFWDNLTPQKKKTIITLGIVVVLIIVGLLGYSSTRSKTPQQKTEAAKKELKFDSTVMEKSLYSETKKEIESLRNELVQIKKAKEEEEKQKQQLPPVPPPPEKKPEKHTALPPPPLPPQGENLPVGGAPQHGEPAKPIVTIEKVGDIAVFSGKIEQHSMPAATQQTVSSATQEDKKKQPDSIYLPPSFMEATLLSGLYAPTVEGGRTNPVPVLLRIKDMAILPNKVKANLKGCFVIAEGYGDLATERANLRLVTLSCLSKKGQSVIDQGIKGFVVDSDGKIGLKGNVVSKMGSAIARSALAGFLGGLGTAIQQAYSTTNVSLAGTTTTVSPSDIGKVAVGQGIAQASQDLKKFYLDLAKQAMPVVEVGATKVVTLVISEGVSLSIKDISHGGLSATGQQSKATAVPQSRVQTTSLEKQQQVPEMQKIQMQAPAQPTQSPSQLQVSKGGQ